MRNIKTEYVSCPSCGRTLFDLQEVTEQIRTRTGHLPGQDLIHQSCRMRVSDWSMAEV
jgi:(E)-4-hydroxy-3-methylbut-2-enyl-diphosphate synthase